jgi:hypothetical protein
VLLPPVFATGVGWGRPDRQRRDRRQRSLLPWHHAQGRGAGHHRCDCGDHVVVINHPIKLPTDSYFPAFCRCYRGDHRLQRGRPCCRELRRRGRGQLHPRGDDSLCFALSATTWLSRCPRGKLSLLRSEGLRTSRNESERVDREKARTSGFGVDDKCMGLGVRGVGVSGIVRRIQRSPTLYHLQISGEDLSPECTSCLVFR